MRFADYPFLRYLPFLVCGALISQKGVQVSIITLMFAIGVLWILYGCVFHFGKGGFPRLVAPLFAYGILFSVGALLSEIQKHGAAKLVDENLGSADFYLGQVEKHDIEKPNSFENQLDVIAVCDRTGWADSQGKVLIYHRSKTPLLPGQVILVERAPEKVPPPTFPDEFDYRAFLARKDIHFRQFVGDKFVVVDSSEIASYRYLLENIRKKLVGIIDEKVPGIESRQIAAALLLGQKENLSKEIKNAYSETGTMHILAVSGLHVGIIYAILLYPLKGIRISARQRKIYLLVVILLIWLYAVLTGFSPSVIRAATMFSLFSAGQMRERKPSPFNVLAFSAMLIIAMDPGVIFEVGFQLSYLAVAGILLFQPLMLHWWLPPNRILEYFWQMAVVSLAAQLATFPLSIFYFHSFPTYFLLANLVIVPISFVVMQVGVPLLLLSWVPVLGDVLGCLIGKLIGLQNWITVMIQQFPGGNLNRLTITFSGMILTWGLMIIWANWQWGDRRKLSYLFLALFIGWSADALIREIHRPLNEVLIFSGEKGILLDFRDGDKIYSWNENFPPEQISFSIDPNRVAQHRPQHPESVRSIVLDSIRWFPARDFWFDPTRKTFTWGKEKPKRVEQHDQTGRRELAQSDSLIADNALFRVVF